ncbi:MAG: hypothetical protein EZS28_048680 [Streblomastix strix]|uniref:Uncharacterized protein n=1 Tax=Streblomastix strix TaxID=222440 RepID=A0A5J4TDF5_9EUKA|nr:MAG: hypothetical protein EZS28_048680 [Streblomastix strix]
MSVCFMRMEEMANIDLSVSIIDKDERSAIPCIPPKQFQGKELYDVRRSTDQANCPTRTLFIWVTRLRQHFNKNQSEMTNLFWTHSWCARSNRKLKHTRIYYKTDSIASALTASHGRKQDELATKTISQQKGAARVLAGDVLQQSPLGDDQQLSPKEILAVSLYHPDLVAKPIEAAREPDQKSALKQCRKQNDVKYRIEKDQQKDSQV